MSLFSLSCYLFDVRFHRHPTYRRLSTRSLPTAGFLLLLLAIPSQLRAQSHPLSFWTGYRFGVPVAVERTAGEVSYCLSCDGTGTSQSHTGVVGFQVSNLFPELGISDLFITSSLSITSGSFRSNAYRESVETDVGRSVVEQEFELSALSAEVGVEIGSTTGNIFPALSGGIWGEYRIVDHLLHRTRLTEPGSLTFASSGSREKILAAGEEIADLPIRGGGFFGVDVPIASESGPVEFVPGLRVRLDAGGLVDGLGIRALAAGVRLEVRSRPAPPPLSPPTPMASSPSPPPSPPAPSVGLQIRALDEAGNRTGRSAVIRLVRERHRYHHPRAFEEVVEFYEVSDIEIDPRLPSEESIIWWRLSLRRMDREIVRRTSFDTAHAFDFDLTEGSPEEVASPLVGELLVQTIHNGLLAARDALRIDLDTTIVFRPEEYSRVVDIWEFSSPEEVLKMSEKLWRKIGVICEEGPGVVIGYDPEKGGEEVAYELRDTVARLCGIDAESVRLHAEMLSASGSLLQIRLER